MKFSYCPYDLTFREPFAIAAGTRLNTPSAFVKIEHEGIIGYGSASMPPYLSETTESVLAFFKKAETFISNFSNSNNIEEYNRIIDNIAPNNTAAKAAIDIALHDLAGKSLKKPCYELYEIEISKLPSPFYTLGIDAPEKIKEKIRNAKEAKCFKVKLGSDHDKEIIVAIREVTSLPICIDANQGWKNKEHAIDMIDWLKDKNVLFIEQPLPKEKKKDQEWLFQNSELLLIADEALQRLDDVEELKQLYHGINIKLMKCTGMSEAYKMIQRARTLDMKVMLGCMSESVIAISAASHFASLVDWVDLDGAVQINNDPFKGTEIVKGEIVLRNSWGVGAELCKGIF